MRIPIALTAAATAVALGLAACGGSSSGSEQASKPVDPNKAEVNPPGDIPDDQVFVAYAPPGGGYVVKVPEGWGRSTNGRAVTFTDKLNSIRMEAFPASGPVTVATAKATELPKIARSVNGYEAGRVSEVSRRAGRAVRITYLAESAPDPVTGKVTRNAVERYEFPHKGSEIVLTLSGPKGADNVDPWKIVTDSLRYTS